MFLRSSVLLPFIEEKDPVSHHAHGNHLFVLSEVSFCKVACHLAKHISHTRAPTAKNTDTSCSDPGNATRTNGDEFYASRIQGFS